MIKQNVRSVAMTKIYDKCKRQKEWAIGYSDKQENKEKHSCLLLLAKYLANNKMHIRYKSNRGILDVILFQIFISSRSSFCSYDSGEFDENLRKFEPSFLQFLESFLNQFINLITLLKAKVYTQYLICNFFFN